MTSTPERSSFLELEYTTLRKEIETSKANMFKLVIGGAAVIPAAQSLGNTYELGAITLSLPLIVVVLVLLFLSENHAMIRAGTYILEEIEPRIAGSGGWETWLNSTKGTSSKRTVDKLLIVAFAVLASSYFMASVLLAARHALKEFGQRGQYVLGGTYLVIGLVLAFVLYSQAQTGTKSTKAITAQMNTPE